MIEVTEVILLHKTLIDNFGGSHGLRDAAALESALARPFQRFDDKELYPAVLEKAAALVESVLINHPFLDGNKRIGYALFRIFLAINDIEITASTDNKYEFIIDIASGVLKFEGIVKWLESHSCKKNGG